MAIHQTIPSEICLIITFILSLLVSIDMQDIPNRMTVATVSIQLIMFYILLL